MFIIFMFLIYLLANDHRGTQIVWTHNLIRFTHLEKETNYPLRYLTNKQDDNKFYNYYSYYYNSHSTVASGEMDTISNDNVVIIIAICNFWFCLEKKKIFLLITIQLIERKRSTNVSMLRIQIFQVYNFFPMIIYHFCLPLRDIFDSCSMFLPLLSISPHSTLHLNTRFFNRPVYCISNIL